MRYKRAERNINDHSFTFLVVPSYHEHTTWNIEVEHWKLYVSVLVLLFTVLFSTLINKYSPKLITALSAYQVATLEQKEYKQKLMSSIQNSIVLKDRLRSLREREANLRDLLSLSPRSRLSLKKEEYYDYPVITAKGGTIAKGETGAVLIDGNPILEYFDSSPAPRATYRAVRTVEMMKVLLASKDMVKKIKVVPSAQNLDEFVAEFNGTALFTVTKDDASQFDTSPYLLAQKWRDDLMAALYLEKKEKLSARLLGSLHNFINKRKEMQYKKFESFFSEIDYPVQTVAGFWQINDPRIRKVNHLLNFIKQESASRRNSYGDLANTVVSYRDRFSLTPSQAPIAYSFVLSPFGWRRHPLTRHMAFHTGLDLPCFYGAPITATAGGKISRAGWLGGYGMTAEVDHGYGIKTLYGHCSELLTRTGQHVRKGQVIARAGATGLASGVHVHYEVRMDNRPINPMHFLNLDIFTACKNW